MRIAGERVERPRTIAVHNPYTGAVVSTVPKATVDDVKRAIAIAKSYRATLTRYERSDICDRAAAIIRSRAGEISDLITAECGICKKDSLYEVGRACDVFTFAGNAALNDDGQIFSCDLTPHGKSRKVYTLREPLQGVIAAITPFNHPLNQVAHKVAPSIATNNRMVLKPTEKTPLSALLLADILYEAGLPPEMFSVVTGEPAEIADEMLASADIDMGTVIETAAAQQFESRVNDAIAHGAKLLVGNVRRGALYSPTVLDHVDPTMNVVRTETFGPVSPVIRFRTIDDAIHIANGTAYGLSSSVCTNRLDYVTRFIAELNVGSVNIREVPGYRLELM